MASARWPPEQEVAGTDTIEPMFESTRLNTAVNAVDPEPVGNLTLLVPTAQEAVQAGFPSPAQDYWDGDINLGDQLIRDRTSTFIVKAVGSSMERAGIFSGDRLIVDRSIAPPSTDTS